jgi:predicted protein tyrosine phosphatase
MATARHLVLRFEDTSDAGDPHGFTPALADELVGFAAVMRDDLQERVVVHCGYGISRSPALALGLLVVGAGHDPRGAFEHLFRVRPQAQPNALVVERLDAAAGLDGALWRVFEAWAHQQGWWPYPDRWLADAPREERLAALEPMVRCRLAMERRGSAPAPRRSGDRTS